MAIGIWDVLSILLWCLSTGCEAYHWTSSGTLPDGTTIHVCSGDNVTLGWAFTVDQTEQTMTTQWYFLSKDKLSGAVTNEDPDRILIATQTGGFFLKTPSAHQQLMYVPNAGLQLLGVTSHDSGTYSVSVNLNAQGDAIVAQQHVMLNVSDTECTNVDREISALTDEINQLEEENQRMKDRAEILSRYPPYADAVHRPFSCVDVQKYDPNNGVHTLYMSDGTHIKVYCDQSISGGWAVFQRRVDGTTNFNRGWQDYEDGFGFVEGEFWIGLWNLYLLTSEVPMTLRVELVSFDDKMYYAEYNQFSIGNRSTQYRQNPGVFSHGTLANNLGDGRYSNQPFSTYDKPVGYNCPQSRHGGWWFNNGDSSCTNMNLNGQYFHEQTNRHESITWQYNQNNFKRAEMKLKPI